MSDTSVSSEFPIGSRSWTSRWSPHGPTSQVRSPVLKNRTRLQAHVPERQMAPGHFHLRRSSFPFPVPSPTQFTPRPPHTRNNSFPGPYVMPSHIPLIQNQPSQPPAYFAYHPIEPNAYPPAQYFPFPPHPAPVPYSHHEVGVRGGHPFFHRAQHHPVPVPQTVANVPGSSYPGSLGGMQQFQPPPYSLTDQFGSTQQGGNPWHYHHPTSSPDTFSVQPRQQYPVDHAHCRTHRLPAVPDSASVQLADSKLAPPPSVDPGTASAAPTTSWDVTLPSTPDVPGQGGPQKVETNEPSRRVENTSRVHGVPPVRRSYHPNPAPNRSEWVMWVGNVPGDATHDELWKFLKSSTPGAAGSGDARRVQNNGILSLFLISRSNCAFVNYDSQQQLDHAITLFNGRKLRPDDRNSPRLVCRARRKEDDLRAGVGAQRGINLHTRHVKKTQNDRPAGEARRTNAMKNDPPPAARSFRHEVPSPSGTEERTSPVVQTQSRQSSYLSESTTSSFLARHFPRRFFILKSLTQYDLDLSVGRGVWATQKHNETILDQAFRTSQEVILVFSVNKSGEFYGYARMTSSILQSNYNISWAPRAESSSHVSTPSQLPSQEAQERSSHPNPNPGTSPLPSGSRFADAPVSDPPSTDEADDCPGEAGPSHVESSVQRRSAPPTLHPASQDVESRLSQNHSPSSILQSTSGREIVVEDDDDNDLDFLGEHFQAIMEDAHRGVEDGSPPSPTGRSEVQQEGVRQALTVPQPKTGRFGDRQGEVGWGEPFQIQWLRTERVPFHRTRHLRNPWNHDREIKIARDGTEMEPAVGQRLIEEWPTLSRHSGRRARTVAAAHATTSNS